MSGLRDEYGELAAFMNLDGDLCDFCQRRCDDVEPVTITDTSGGGSARLCASCRAFATATRCGLCGSVKGCDGKADSIHFGISSGNRATRRRRSATTAGRMSSGIGVSGRERQTHVRPLPPNWQRV